MAAAIATPSQDEASETAAPTAVHNSSLYVGDLDREVSEAQLFELFSQIGPVASIRVCRDTVTRRSLGYAYVNYNSTLDGQAAERALDTLNYAPLHNKPMRIMWSHRDPASRRSGVGNIFIKNLDKEIDNKALHDTFSAFGNILSCKVVLDPLGASKGYGFVHYESGEAASMAIEKVNGMLLEGRKVFVGPFLKRADRPDNVAVRFTNVFVKNLAESVTEDALKELFGKHGNVTSVAVMKDEEDKTRGFGFVNFEDADEAAAAVEALNDQDLEGKPLFAGRAQKKSEREASLKQKFEDIRNERTAKYQGMNLYVKNLVDEVDDDKLRAQFESYGTITSAKVMCDSDDKSKGFGFVCFTTPEEATRAVSETNGNMFMGKPLYVALAQRQDVRKAQLEQQYTVPRVPGMPAGRGAGPNAPNAMAGGMFPLSAPNPMFYQGAPPGAVGGRGGAFGYPQMMQRGMGGGRGGRGGGRGMPMMPPELAMMAGYPAPNGYGGPMMGGRGGRGGRGRGPRGDFGPDGYGGGDFGGRGGHGGRGDMMRGGPRIDMPARGRGMANGGRGGPPAGQGTAPPPAAPGAASAVVPGEEGSGLTTAMLAAAHPEQQKQMLGERLFPLVERMHPDIAGKITGMLLEMDNSELLLLLESKKALESKVDEAIQVLQQHNVVPQGDGDRA